MDERSAPRGLPAGDFFDLKLPGFNMSDAHVACRFSYSAVHDCARGKTSTPNKQLLIALQQWSSAAIDAHGVFISAARTLGLPQEPSAPLAVVAA